MDASQSFYLVKFGYMVERRSIIFSKLFEGRALSAATGAAVGAATTATAAAVAGGGGGPAPGGTLTEAAPAEGGATAARAPVLAPFEVLRTGGSDVLGAELLLSPGGWGWGCGWFCCCPGTW